MAADLMINNLVNGTLTTDDDGLYRWTGTGYFDKLIAAVSGVIEAEYNNGRLKGTDYANVLLGGLQSTLQQSMLYMLEEQKTEATIDLIRAQITAEDRNAALRAQQIASMIVEDGIKTAQSAKDLSVKDKQIAKLQSDIDKAAYEVGYVLPAQKSLITRQEKGFDDDAKQKLLKQTLDSWSVAYSVAQDANSIPDTIKVNVIDSITKNAMDSLAITKTNDPLGEV